MTKSNVTKKYSKKISVIITSYNYADSISDAINSVLCQTFKNFELIIIDDGSTDGSLDVIEKYSILDDRIRVIKNQKNIGLAKTLQKAVKETKGEWIAFLESDDILRPTTLDEKLTVIKKYPNVGLVYNNVDFFGEQAEQAKKRLKKIIKKNKKFTKPKSMFYNFGYENPILTMSSVMVKSKFLKNIKFDSPIDKLVDWYIYIQIASKTKFVYLDKNLTLFRQHKNSYIKSKNNVRKFANISAYIEIFKQQPYNFKLLIFILISVIMMCFKRGLNCFGIR